MSDNAEVAIRELALKLKEKSAECRCLADKDDWQGVRRAAEELQTLEAQLQSAKDAPLRTNIVGRVRVQG